jgi:hypothetical protein
MKPAPWLHLEPYRENSLYWAALLEVEEVSF